MMNKKPKSFLATFLVLTFILFQSNSFLQVSAYSQPSDKFWVGPNLKNVFYAQTGFGSTSISHMNEAMWNWNSAVYNVASRYVLEKATTTHSKTKYPDADEQYCIYRLADSTKPLAEATTLRSKPWNASRYQVYDADILMNVSYNYANGNANGYDFWSVFMHEVGHTIGLNHSSISSASMYGTFAKGELRRSLSQDDKNGIKAIYQ